MRIAKTAPDAYSIDQGRVYDTATSACRTIDQLEAVLVKMPQAECPVVHRFTPGLYSRECFTRKGLVFTSRIHAQDHQGVLSMGHVLIWCEGKGWVEVMSPYHFITPAGTRRVVVTLEDTICTTFHPTDLTDIAAIEALLYVQHDGPSAANALNP